MEDCRGCRTCELACSFYHCEEFNPIFSSIRILEKDNNEGFLINLIEDNVGEAIRCDGCKNNNNGPLCVEFCHKRDILQRIIKNFVK